MTHSRQNRAGVRSARTRRSFPRGTSARPAVKRRSAVVSTPGEMICSVPYGFVPLRRVSLKALTPPSPLAALQPRFGALDIFLFIWRSIISIIIIVVIIIYNIILILYITGCSCQQQSVCMEIKTVPCVMTRTGVRAPGGRPVSFR